MPADHRDRVGRDELRRACIIRSCCGAGDQRELRCRFDRILHSCTNINSQRESDCVAFTDEQRNAHPSIDAHSHWHSVAHGIAHPHRYADGDAWPHTRWHGTQSQGTDPDVSLHLGSARKCRYLSR